VRNQPDMLLLAVEHWALAVREGSVRPDFVQRQRALRDTIIYDGLVFRAERSL
jgi:hypothetical protein